MLAIQLLVSEWGASCTCKTWSSHRASFAWQHAFDKLVPDTAFSSTDIGFGAVPIEQNSAFINVGVDLNFSPIATLGVSYAGQFASNLENNAFTGRFKWLF
jgi:outer membrane autotransporter protein